MKHHKTIIDGPIIHSENGRVVENILRALPDWFGIEEAIIHYRDFRPLEVFPTLIVPGG